MSFQIQYTSIIITYFVTKMQLIFVYFSFEFQFLEKCFLYFFLSNFFFLIKFFFLLFFFSFFKLFSSIIYQIYYYFFLISLFCIIIIFFIEHAYFTPNIWVLHKPFKKTSWHFMLQMWVLQN